MEEKKPGRPTVMTPEVISKLEDSFLYDMTHDEACLRAGISRSTLGLYLSENPEWRERVELLRNQPFTRARIAWINSFSDESKPNVDAAIKYLERKKKDEFSPRSEVTGKDGEGIEFGVVILPQKNPKS